MRDLGNQLCHRTLTLIAFVSDENCDFCNFIQQRAIIFEVDPDPKLFHVKFLALRVARKFIALRITCAVSRLQLCSTYNYNSCNIIYSEAERIFRPYVAVPITSYGEQSGDIKHTKSTTPNPFSPSKFGTRGALTSGKSRNYSRST